MPRVYIIIVNYNGWKDTIECLESLLKLKYENFRIIVIDNSPDASSYEGIRRWATEGFSVETAFPDLVFPLTPKPLKDFAHTTEQQLLDKNHTSKIMLVKAYGNQGFSAANNAGLKYALRMNDFEFAWLLNNDTVVAPDSLSQLVACMSDGDKHRVGILGAKVMEYENPAIIQSAGGGRLIRPLALSKLIGRGQLDSGQFDLDNLRMDFVAGTSMIVRKGFLKDVGLMDEDYFLYFEEPDWAERGRKHKWKIHYCYRAVVYHKGGATTGGKGYSSKNKGSTDLSDYYFQRARVLFTRKHYWYLIPSVYFSFLIVVINRLRRRQFHRIKGLLTILIHPQRKFRKN